MVQAARLELARGLPSQDFKSCVSTDSTTPAFLINQCPLILVLHRLRQDPMENKSMYLVKLR